MKIFHKMFVTVFVGMMFVSNVNTGVSFNNLRNNASNPHLVFGAATYIILRDHLENKAVKAGCDAAVGAAVFGGRGDQVVSAAGVGLVLETLSGISYVETINGKIPVSKDTKSWLKHVFNTSLSIFLGAKIGDQINNYAPSEKIRVVK